VIALFSTDTIDATTCPPPCISTFIVDNAAMLNVEVLKNEARAVKNVFILIFFDSICY
jgi:hypothetical protein